MLGKFATHVRQNLVAYLALFVALGGTSYAAATIGSAEVVDDSLLSRDLKNGAAVKSVDVANDSTTGALTGLDVSNANGGALSGQDISEGTLAGVDATSLEGFAPDDFYKAGEKVGDADTLDGADSTAFQRRGSTTSCSGSQKVTGIGPDGNVSCADSDSRYYTRSESDSRYPKAYFDRVGGIPFTLTPGSTNQVNTQVIFTIPGWGYFKYGCFDHFNGLFDEKRNWFGFFNTSGGALRVYGGSGGSMETAVLGHGEELAFDPRKGPAGSSLWEFQLGRETDANQRLATVWITGNPSEGSTCETNAQAIVQGG